MRLIRALKLAGAALAAALVVSATSTQASAKPPYGRLPYGQWIYGFRAQPAPRSQARRVDPTATIRGGDNASLSLDPKEMVELLADPQMSAKGKLALEEELLAYGVEVMPALVWLASEPPQGRPGERDLRAISAALLYRLLMPELEPGDRAPQHLVVVEDWRGWWIKRSRRSLEELQREVAGKLLAAKKSGKLQTLL